MKHSMTILAVLMTLSFSLPTEARPTGKGKRIDSSRSQRTRQTQSERATKKSERATSPQQQANINKLKQDLQSLKSDSQVTQWQKDQLANDLRNLAEGTQKPSQASVDKLASDLTEALADGNLSKAEQVQLSQDIAAVMNSANIPPDEVQAALASAQDILESSNLDQSDVTLIMNDLNAIASEMQ